MAIRDEGRLLTVDDWHAPRRHARRTGISRDERQQR